MGIEDVQFCCCLLSPHRMEYLELQKVKSLFPRQPTRRWWPIWKNQRSVSSLGVQFQSGNTGKHQKKSSAYLIQATKWALAEEFQPFWKELSRIPESIDYSTLCLLTSSLSAKSIMSKFMNLSAPLRLPKIVLQGFSEVNERAGPL